MGKSFLWGTLGFLGLNGFYFLIMGLLSRSITVTVGQFVSLWPWILALTLGFGVQVGLFVALRQKFNELSQTGMVAASGTTSALGMVACCAHHLTDFLPLLGLSAASLFLLNYQKPILVVSLLINLLGIFTMLKKLKEVKKNET